MTMAEVNKLITRRLEEFEADLVLKNALEAIVDLDNRVTALERIVKPMKRLVELLAEETGYVDDEVCGEDNGSARPPDAPVGAN